MNRDALSRNITFLTYSIERPATHPPFPPPIHPSFAIHLFIHQPFHPSIPPSTYVSVRLSICLSLCLSLRVKRLSALLRLSDSPFLCPISTHLSACGHAYVLSCIVIYSPACLFFSFSLPPFFVLLYRRVSHLFPHPLSLHPFHLSLLPFSTTFSILPWVTPSASPPCTEQPSSSVGCTK